MPSNGTGVALMGFRVAGLELWLDARGTGLCMAAPPGHARFLVLREEAQQATEIPRLDGRLVLQVGEGAPMPTSGWHCVFSSPETWELWQDAEGRALFVAPRFSPPPRQIVVEADFRSGRVLGRFAEAAAPGQADYPLQDVDMVLFANWLARRGEVILHAAGVDDQGAGYCFAGPGGSGKSTLADWLADHTSAAVLSEDQAILRCAEDRFWIYGTPWHENPSRACPAGVPLSKLFFLDRTAAPGVAPCRPAEGIGRLLQTAFIPYYSRDGVTRILDSLARLAEQVPFYTLSCGLGADILRLARQA